MPVADGRPFLGESYFQAVMADRTGRQGAAILPRMPGDGGRIRDGQVPRVLDTARPMLCSQVASAAGAQASTRLARPPQKRTTWELSPREHSTAQSRCPGRAKCPLITFERSDPKAGPSWGMRQPRDSNF